MSEQHDPCLFVTREIGENPDADSLAMLGDPELTAEVTNTILATYQRAGQDDDPIRQTAILALSGEIPRGIIDDPRDTSEDESYIEDIPPSPAAEHALRALGCNSCVLAMNCPVKVGLEQSRQDFNIFQDMVGRRMYHIMEHLRDLREAPTWLEAARDRRTSGMSTWLTKLLAGAITTTSPDVLDTELSEQQVEQLEERIRRGGNPMPEPEYHSLREITGNLNLATEPRISATKSKLPELQNIKPIAEHDPISGVAVFAGDRLMYIFDASDQVGMTLPEEEAAILYAKLLGRLVQEDTDGKASIESPDNTMLKVIRNVEGGMLCELRMTGKNRLYLTICPAQANKPLRVVILGGHGGNDATQRSFINKLVE